MSESKFKTMRHIEAVRNYLNFIIKRLVLRGENHDQSKLQSPEVEIFEKYTPKLRGVTYGSEKYKKYMTEMKPAIEHHNKNNRHHPEHFTKLVCNGCFKEYKDDPTSGRCDVCGYGQFQEEADFMQMNLIDLVELICDWKAATLRHNDGCIYKSLEINQKRFKYSDDIKQILRNTVDFMEDYTIINYADES